MLARQRQGHILAQLRQGGAVRVSELTAALGVSDMTIRRDLDAMAAEGLLRKVHGGAVLEGRVAFEPGFAAKSQISRSTKEAIGAKAAALVQPGAAIALSAGTTTTAMAPYLVTIPALTVVTNSTTVADAITQADPAGRLSVILTGGVRTPSAALVGPIADRAIGSMHVDLLFLGVHGMDQRAGFTTPNLAEATTNRALVDSAREVVVVADSSKWGMVGLADIGPFSLASSVITDDDLPPEGHRALAEAGCSVTTVAAS